jgi:hypothetical protein
MGLWYRANSPRRDQVQQRKNERKSMRQAALLRAIEDGSELGQCVILDASAGGARLRVRVRPTFPIASFWLCRRTQKPFDDAK